MKLEENLLKYMVTEISCEDCPVHPHMKGCPNEKVDYLPLIKLYDTCYCEYREYFKEGGKYEEIK